MGCYHEILTTLADVFAASTNLAPIKFATLVEPAIDNGNGIWKVVDVTVTSTLCAARWATPILPLASVRISNANHSATTMTMPGNASRTIGPQFLSAALLKPPHACLPSTFQTYNSRSKGSIFCVVATARGAPMKPHPSFHTKSQLSSTLAGAAISST